MKKLFNRSITLAGLTVLSIGLLASVASPGATLTTIYSFPNASGGTGPTASLVQGRDGLLYGTTDKGGLNGKGVVYSISTNGAFTTLYSFTLAGTNDGAPHISDLVEGSDGKFYGVTQNGGPSSGPFDFVSGTAFDITTNGTFSSFYTFPGINLGEKARLIQGSDGNFYGTIRNGGSLGFGSVFRLTVTPSVTFTNVFSFDGTNNGAIPFAGLIQGSDGNLYGTTHFGGLTTNGVIGGYGTVFGVGTNLDVMTVTSNIIVHLGVTNIEFTTNFSASPRLVHFFTNDVNGSRPSGALVQGDDGKLYGTASSAGGGFGTIFSLTTNDTFALLHSFTSGNNGGNPLAGVTLGNDGKFYGTTIGNDPTNTGVIFSVSTDGVYSVLFTLNDHTQTNGQFGGIGAPLLLADDGNFYGTTEYGGTNHNGTIFRLSLSGGGGTPPVITLQPPPAISNFAGGVAVLSVAADNATGFQWFKSSSKVANSARISGATTGTLTISNLTTADAGVYHVVISNLVGSVTSSNATLVVLIPDTIKPTLTITVPKAAQNVSNELFNASGTAKDAGGVAAVFYQLNGGDWTNAGGTTNWTAALTLTPGANTLRVYAVDTSANFSTTNSVTFTYVLTAPVTVQIVGQGTVTPNLNGKPVAIGKPYSMTAKAAKGFKFRDWSGSTNSNTAKLSFMGASNLVFTATFVDIARPVDIITFPGANKTVSNALFATSGKASDNVGVTSVWFHVNSWPWFPANTTNSWTNWTAPYFALLSGPDTVQAYAIDAAGNISLTNTVKFNYKVLPTPDWAPDDLNGLVGQVAMSNDSPITVAFDPANFSQTGDGTNADDFGLGSYLYTKLATNLAELSITNYGPPPKSNVSVVSLIFTNHYSGTFTNSDGDPGNINLAIGTSFVPATLAKRTLVAVDPANTNTSTIKILSDGSHFTQSSTRGGNSSGTLTFYRFSPIAALMSLSYTNGNYVQVQATFTSAKGGTYFAVINDVAGPPPILNAGTFTLK